MADGFKYEFIVKPIDLATGTLVCVLHEDDARKLGILPIDRIELFNPRNKKRVVCIADITNTIVKKGEVGLFKEVKKELAVAANTKIFARVVQRPESIEFIRKKLQGLSLDRHEIYDIVRDINNNKLSSVEIAFFMAGVYVHGYSLDETISMTKALVDNGRKLKINREPLVDKHCIGGTNGRTTMIVVPIIAAANLYIPKTSSRAITSAAGTADAMEVIAKVNLSARQIKKITETIGGVIAWGGALDLAPVDDKIIQIEHPLSLDPDGQIIASVMAKKASVGSKHVVIDLPVGPDVKIKTEERARRMAKLFLKVGKALEMDVDALITDGTKPYGRGFGPALEAREALEILEGKRFDDLAKKSCELAGILFESVGYARRRQGFKLAKEILQSGEALEKMKEIINAQGKRYECSERIPKAKFSTNILATASGKIASINIKNCIRLARLAGAPG
ncbi:MAG: thymidine phosphorylase, partial [Candidatus Diapherotrites archaeon]|nr:thymidine phosphorylase [Candidatus Diapherotrites archaeon]